MEIYLAGTDVTLTVPLQDRGGNPLNVTSVSYRVVTQDGSEIVALTPIGAFVAGSATAVVTIAALLNQTVAIPPVITSSQIDQFSAREARTVELLLLVGGNTVMISKTYALEGKDPLFVGINSFQTLSEAELTSLDIPNVTGWSAASELDKIAALIDARSHICQLNFAFSFDFDQSSQTPYASPGNLASLTPTQFLSLSIRFRAALRKAQVAEADSILGGDPVEVRRQEGLLLESIGEVKQMFRSGKPLNLPVSKRALRYLSEFVTFTKKIGRG